MRNALTVVDRGQAQGRANVDGPRHEDTHRWCDYLERMWRGAAAAELLSSDSLPEDGGALFLAPMWTWVVPAVSVGRKAKSASGEPHLMPVRVHWSIPAVEVVEDGCDELATYQCKGLGLESDGAVALQPSTGSGFPGEIPDPASVPCTVRSSVRTTRELADVLSGLVEDGHAARWEAFSFMESMLAFQVRNAHRHFSHEIQPKGGVLLSDQSLESLMNEILLGHSGADSFAFRMIEQSVGTADLFVNVDPLHWLKTVVRRQAQQALQDRIGDPHIGPRIRRVARELNTTDTAAVMAAYREKHRSDLPSTDRTRNALSVAADPMACPVNVDEAALAGAKP